MPNVVEDLRAARELLLGGMSHGAYARDARGAIVAIDAREAARFCPMGAIKRVCGWRRLPRVADAMNALRGVLGIRTRGWGKGGPDADIEDWFDAGQTKAATLLAFDRAIASEERT